MRKTGKELLEALGNPWSSDLFADEINLPVWVIELLDDARTELVNLANGFERMTIAADQMAFHTNSGQCDAIISDSRELFEKYL